MKRIKKYFLKTPYILFLKTRNMFVIFCNYEEQKIVFDNSF